VGYDYYMYVGVPRSCPGTEEQARRLGLYVESFRSPYRERETLERGMTTEEWETSNDPREMLETLRGRAGERKPRLFAVACCRVFWPLLVEPRSRRAADVAEAFADGQVDAAALEAASADAEAAFDTVARPLGRLVEGTQVQRAAHMACLTTQPFESDPHPHRD